MYSTRSQQLQTVGEMICSLSHISVWYVTVCTSVQVGMFSHSRHSGWLRLTSEPVPPMLKAFIIRINHCLGVSLALSLSLSVAHRDTGGMLVSFSLICQQMPSHVSASCHLTSLTQSGQEKVTFFFTC